MTTREVESRVFVDVSPSPAGVCLQAHTHHYLEVDGFEQQDFTDAQESLTSLICEYSELNKQMDSPPEAVPRLQVLT